MTQQDIRGSYDAYIQIQGKLPVRLRLLPARSMRLGLNLKKKNPSERDENKGNFLARLTVSEKSILVRTIY